MFLGSILLVVLGSLTAAQNIVRYPEETYLWDGYKEVDKSRKELYKDIKEIDSKGKLVNEGEIIFNSQDGARMEFQSYDNAVFAKTTINGASDMNLRFQATLTNEDGSKFNLDVGGDLDFTVGGAVKALTNAGSFSISSKKSEVKVVGNFINDNAFSIQAKEEGTFKFGKVVNVDSLKFNTGSTGSLLSFGALENSGKISLHCDEEYGTAVKFRTYVYNTGSISLSVQSGEGEIVQNGDIENDGLICFSNMIARQEAGIAGNGCWVVNEGSLSLDGSYRFDQNQKILLDHQLAYVYVRNIGVSGKVLDIYGFLKAKAPIRAGFAISRLIYDEASGHLELRDKANESVIFNIGEGYNKDRFRITNRAVSYVGDVPPERTSPSKCQCPDSARH